MKQPAIYIVIKKNGTLYTSVTSNLVKRIYEYKSKASEGFTSRYDCTNLVYYECFDDMISAITREKQLKSGSRKKKLAVIESLNPEWQGLYSEICF